MKKIYKKRIKKLYHKFDYTQAKSKIPNASFLLVTRNRCPYANYNKNPLFWSLITMIKSNEEFLNEIIVIDDKSNDYTYSTVKEVIRKTGFDIVYYKNNKRMGCSYSRQIAMEKSNNDFVFMGDDDCLYVNDFAIGALISFLDVIKLDSKIAVLNLPVFERATFPQFAVDKTSIGKWIISDTHFYQNFDKLPIQYLRNSRYSSSGVLLPLAIDIIYGVNLSYKKYILNSGGYDDLSMWTNDYSEHMEVSYKLKKNKYSLYHQPDPRFGSIHLKYGSQTNGIFDRRCSKIKFSGLKFNLGEMIEYSQKEKNDTGARINDYDFYLNQIGSFFSFYVKISKKLAIKFAIKEYGNFVLNNHIFSTTPSLKFSLSERENIFRRAIKKGIEISNLQSKKCFDDVKKIIFTKIQK